MDREKEIFILLGVCHGKTEEVFLTELYSKYKTLFLHEKKLSKTDEYGEEPNLLFFANKDKIQTTEFKKKLKAKLEDELFINTIVDDPKELVYYKIHFITIIDFMEDGHDPSYEKMLLETSAKQEILDVLDKIDITGIENFDHKNLFKGSTLIFFNRSIESSFKYFMEEENGQGSYWEKKPKKMRKWLRNQDWNSLEEMKDYFNDQIINREDNNLNDLFNLFEKILTNFIDYKD